MYAIKHDTDDFSSGGQITVNMMRQSKAPAYRDRSNTIPLLYTFLDMKYKSS